jgi:DNA-binding HxlR family transcriptional regulator
MRSYQQTCGVAKALDVVGERWTLLIVRNLLIGGQRYKDLLDTLPGITTNLLAARLRAMQKAGLLERRRTAGPAQVSLYELTERGRQLEAVVLALGRFGAPYLASPKRGDRGHPRWAMLSLKRRFQGSTRAGSLQLAVAAERRFVVRFTRETIDVREGEVEQVDARVELSEATLRELLFSDASAATLIAAGAIRVSGDEDALHALLEAIGKPRALA